MASVALGLVLILALFGLVALWTIHESADAAYRERVTLARTLASRVDDALRYASSTLEHAAAEITVEPRRSLTQSQLQRLDELRHGTSVFAALSILDRAGHVLWARPAPDDAVSQALGPGPVQDALRTGQSQIAEFRSPHAPAKVYARLVVPLRDADGGLAGLLVADVDPAQPALNLLPAGDVGDGVYTQLVNTSGGMLASSRGFDPRLAAEHRLLLSELMDAGASGYRVHEPPPGVPFPSHVVAYAPLSLLPTWGVAVEQPVDAVLALPRRLQDRLLLFGFAAMLVAAAVAWFDVRRVVRPLKHLTAAAERFAAGHLDRPIALDRSDELGILARAFETMRQRLSASLAEVAEWNRSALLEPERVIALVVGKARNLVDADVAGLSLVEEGSGDLTWRLMIGASDRFREIRLRPGEGIAGHVVQTGRPLLVTDWAQPRPDGPATAPIVEQENLRAVLAVPLQSRGRTLGVLLVANRVPSVFGDDQVTLLSSLADQAAVALENARLYRKVQDLAILEERERIAREMHDGLGQVLAYVNVEMLSVSRLLQLGQLEEAQARVARIEAAAKEVYADVREAILGLRTTLTPEHGFLPALQEYLEGFGQQSGLPVDLTAPTSGNELRLPLAAEIQLLRIVQEALANVRKHARATRASIQLALTDTVVQLVIEDDGQGFDPSHLGREGWPRFGLQTMRERAEAVGGTLTVDARPGAGVRVTVVIPRAPSAEFSGAPARPPYG